MSNYPTLQEMDISEESARTITRYTLRQEGNEDVLKVYFRREKGSFLPKSKKYKFGRATNTHRVESTGNKYQEVTEISPFLSKALSELNQIVRHEKETIDTKQKLLTDIDHLEKVLANKIKELREDIDKLA